MLFLGACVERGVSKRGFDVADFDRAEGARQGNSATIRGLQRTVSHSSRWRKEQS